MRKLFAILLLAASAVSADDLTYRSIQSGPNPTGTPIYDHGIRGEGQIIAFLDTGVDYDSCYFAEPDGSRPPINTRLDSNNVDLTRRKVVAYDFLYSCDASFPPAPGCDDPNDPTAYDNARHGTVTAAAAVADRGSPAHDYADGVATHAKMIVQDGGYIGDGGDNCSDRPGFGCPVNLTPILDQAYRQGARIHSNSWGDRQGVPAPLAPPTGNYSAGARDIDAFVWSHPDMLVIFNTGNANGSPPPSSLSAPGDAKNTIQVGGTRDPMHFDDDYFSWFSLIGPTRDGRIKPDLIAPAYATLADSDGNVSTNNCNATTQIGTSYASPVVAGAAALVRQYYTEGFYPTGVATVANRILPSAALMKATLIAAARRAPYVAPSTGQVDTKPVPSYEQGFGFPVLDDALYFPADRAKLRVLDVPLLSGLAEGENRVLRFNVHSGTPLKVVLVWTDPPGVPRGVSDSTPELVNDLDLRVNDPAGALLFGNEVLHPGQPDRLNNVEVVSVPEPLSGTYLVSTSAKFLGLGPRQSFALVVTGDIDDGSARFRAVRH